MITEQARKRFGFLAVEMGFITQAQLIEAMKIQLKEEMAGQKRRRIGEILVGRGSMTPEQVDKVLEEMVVPEF